MMDMPDERHRERERLAVAAATAHSRWIVDVGHAD
jgi:hypothetical protein